MRFLLIVAGAIFLLSACVPNRKYVYLQKDDVNKKDLPKDTVVRSYELNIDDYRIQPLDLLSIRIESLTDKEFDFFEKLYPSDQAGGNQNNLFLTGFLVDNQGEIEFPVVGRIKFAGLSVFQAEEKLQEVFNAFLKNPIARVRLLNFRFTVLGEVNRESQLVSVNSRVTMMEAIGLAGGLTDLADRANVKIIRQQGSTSEVFYVDLLREDFLASNHYYIQQNDIIVVPALKQRPFRRYWGQNLSLFVSTISVVLLTINLLK
jgi:polysaccharide export outer membrane protein